MLYYYVQLGLNNWRVQGQIWHPEKYPWSLAQHRERCAEVAVTVVNRTFLQSTLRECKELHPHADQQEREPKGRLQLVLRRYLLALTILEQRTLSSLLQSLASGCEREPLWKTQIPLPNMHPIQWNTLSPLVFWGRWVLAHCPLLRVTLL